MASVFWLFNRLKIRKVNFFQDRRWLWPPFLAEPEIVYVRDRDCLCPRQRLSMSETETIYVRDRECLCPRQRVSMSETESVYVRDRECLCPRQRVSMSETESFSETHTECFRVINWPPSRLRTCFRHQSESKWCKKFAGNVRNVRSTLKIMQIRFHFFSRTKNSKFWKKITSM